MKIGDNVYILYVEYNYSPSIINSNVVGFIDASEHNLPFYVEEAIIIALKKYIDNNEQVSFNTIYKYFNIFKYYSEISFCYLKKIIKNLNNIFIDTDEGSFPIDLVSCNREPLKRFKDFIININKQEFTIDEYIKKNFR